MKKSIRIISGILALCCVALWSGMLFSKAAVNDRYRVTAGEELSLSRHLSVHPLADADSVAASQLNRSDSQRAVVKLFGLFPLKTVTVQTVCAPTVALCGMPFGIKMYIDGVLVVGLSDVSTAVGNVGPAQSAGLKVGDVLLSLDGTPVSTNAQVAALIETSQGRAMHARVRRDGVEFDASFAPAYSPTDGCYKAGLWVRDSAAGIGTLTFYVPETGRFGSLGHAVCDVDTGEQIPIATGEIVPAKIFGVKKGAKGTPGELQGVFDGHTIGTLTDNGEMGVFGVMTEPPADCPLIPVQMKQAVITGAAQIYTTVDGSEPAYYDVVIEEVKTRSAATRNMVIRITDERLLAQTGGIVQGMSGSPIIQNGKLVGAVTHVFVSDPTRGYGIFAENMLETAQSVADNQLKDAS